METAELQFKETGRGGGGGSENGVSFELPNRACWGGD